MENRRSSRRLAEYAQAAAPVILLVAIVSLLWCSHQNRWTLEAWRTPIGYHGDSWWGMASAKATASGELSAVWKEPRSLGAPFGANWNDYPSVEEVLVIIWAFLVSTFGLYAGSNAFNLLGHLLAALGFYFAGRQFGYDRIWSVVGATLFSLSHYAFFRGLAHVGLVYYWHIPLGILVAYWCFRDERLAEDRRKLIICVLVAICFGAQNPYYSGMFLQFLGAVFVLLLIQRRPWQRAVLPIAFGTITVATFASMNLETMAYRAMHGPNPGAVVRSYGELELYALKPIELLLPRWHSITPLQTWARDVYYGRAFFIGEGGAPYLGWIAIATLALLFIYVLRRIALRGGEPLPLHLWALLWLVAFSIAGGVNGLVGTTGLILFRASNRYSIFMLAVVLLFLVRELTRVSRTWPATVRAACALPLIAIGFYDQVPPTQWHQLTSSIRQMLTADKEAMAHLERRLRPDAMVFQLPVIDFPESPPVGSLSDYELFRPYLNTSNLRFSYGSGKGRYRSGWQRDTEQIGLPKMLNQLEKYGFSAVLIHKKGYADKGAALRDGFEGLNRADVIVNSPEYLAIALQPKSVPDVPPEFGQGWFSLEGNSAQNMRWSSGNATIMLTNPTNKPKTVQITFALTTLQPRQLRISTSTAVLFDGHLDPGPPVTGVEQTISLPPGRTALEFVTDTPAEEPGNGDGRKLAFAIVNFDLVEEQ